MFGIGVIVLWSLLGYVDSSLDEARLIAHLLHKKQDILKEADKIVRPVMSESSPLEVEFALGVSQLAEFSEEKQTLDILIWENMRWTDEFLRWNRSEFNDIEVTLIPVDKIWVPDVIPYRIMEFKSPTVAPYMAMVSYEGQVTFVPQRVYSILCAVDVLYFPRDVHTCNLTYGSWAYSEEALNMTFYEGSTGIIAEQFIQNQKWNLVNLTVQRKHVTFACCKGHYIMFEYSITIQRQMAFFGFVIILPAVMLSVLTLVAFCLPPDCTEKINIGLSIFLSYFVLLVILVESSPAVGTTVPLIGQFFSLSLVLIAFSVFCSAFVYNLRDRERRGVPFPTTYLNLVVQMATFLCLDTSILHNVERKDQLLNYKEKKSCEDSQQQPWKPCGNKDGLERGVGSSDVVNRASVAITARDVADLAQKGDSCSPPKYSSVWILLASIFDRIFLIVYAMINIVSGILIYCVGISLQFSPRST